MTNRQKHGTPNDHGLRLEDDTTAGDVRDFVRERLENPIVYGDHDVIVWNLSTHSVDWDALDIAAPKLAQELYVIPYQVTGAWGYIQRLLPKRVREAEILAYSQRDGRYKAFPNMRQRANDARDRDFRAMMAQEIHQQLEEHDAGD